MGKKKRFLSMLMGAISSLSIAGAKGQNKNPEVKTGNSVSMNVSKGKKKRSEKTTDKTNNVTSRKKTLMDLLGEQLQKKIQDEFSEKFSRLADSGVDENKFEDITEKVAPYLKASDDMTQLIGTMYKSFKSGNLQKDTPTLFKAFVPIYQKQLLEDLKKQVNNVSYGFTTRWSMRGCCVSLDNAKKRLGKSYWYDLSDLRDLKDEEAESIVLRTVLSHLMISDLRKLESKSYEKKSTFDIMKQMILSIYVSKDDSFGKVSPKLAGGVDRLILEYNKGKKQDEKIAISWIKQARQNISKDKHGDGYSWTHFSKTGLKARRHWDIYASWTVPFLYGIFNRTFDKADKLNFVK